jgi:hypothetical protein
MNRRNALGLLAATPAIAMGDKFSEQNNEIGSASSHRGKGTIGLHLSLKYVFTAWVQVDPPLFIGQVDPGERRVINIIGGSFSGPKIRGTILPGGADWQIVRPDLTAFLEARYTLRTDDGALIYVNNVGIRTGPTEVLRRLASGEEVPPTEYYFRTSPKFETGSEKYAWLNRAIFVAAGKREPANVVLDFFRLT